MKGLEQSCDFEQSCDLSVFAFPLKDHFAFKFSDMPFPIRHWSPLLLGF
jgi:hypothetical protein